MAPSKQTVEEVSLCFFLFLRSTNNPFLHVNLFKGGSKKGGRWVDHPSEGWFKQGWIIEGWTMGGPPFRRVVHTRVDH